MNALEWLTAAGLIVSIVLDGGGLLNHFLTARDLSQQREIEDNKLAIDRETAERKAMNLIVFQKIDDNRAEIQSLRERIVGNHYERPEIDKKYEKLETAMVELGKDIRAGFKDISARFDKLGCGTSKGCSIGEQ